MCCCCCCFFYTCFCFFKNVSHGVLQIDLRYCVKCSRCYHVIWIWFYELDSLVFGLFFFFWVLIFSFRTPWWSSGSQQWKFNLLCSRHWNIHLQQMPRRSQEWWHRSKYKSFSIVCARQPIHFHVMMMI